MTAGNYLTVAQVAEYCKETPRKINNWIDKEKIPFLELPQTGRLIRLEDINILLSKKGIPVIDPGERQ